MQIFTGAGILTSGYLTLREKMSAHHWQILVYLAWFSTTSHLVGLAAIRSHLQASPRRRNVRFGLMMAILVMLLVGMVPTRFFLWDSYTVPFLSGKDALCFFDSRLATRVWTTVADMYDRDADNNKKDYAVRIDADVDITRGTHATLISIMLLVLGLLIRSIKIFPPFSGLLANKMRSRLRDACGRLLVRLWPRQLPHRRAQDGRPSFLQDVYVYCVFVPAVAALYSVRLCLDLLSSNLAQVRLLTLTWRCTVSPVEAVSNAE